MKDVVNMSTSDFIEMEVRRQVREKSMKKREERLFWLRETIKKSGVFLPQHLPQKEWLEFMVGHTVNCKNYSNM